MKLIRCTLAAIAFAAGAIWSLLFGSRKREDGRNLEWTQPTYAALIAGEFSADYVEIKPVDYAYAKRSDRELFERRGWTYSEDAAFPGYVLMSRPVEPEQASDSGKSGRTAQSQAKTSDHTADGPDAPGAAHRRYLIRKGSAYYRPDCQGYTTDRAAAGRYTLTEAIRETHPNGPNGPRDGMTIEPDNLDGWSDRGLRWLAAGAPIGDDFGAFASDDTAYLPHYDGTAPITHDLGTVTRDKLAPTAAEQRERFQEIAGKPRPTAATIRAALVTAEFLAQHWIDADKGGNAEDTKHLATIIDSLAVHLLAMELERDELAATLRKVAEQAKPIDDTDLAELVQMARHVVEASKSPALADMRTARDIIGQLIGAVNDQARKLAGPRTYTDDQRKAAMEALRERTDRMAWPAGPTRNLHQSMAVDAIAKALGLERAK